MASRDKDGYFTKFAEQAQRCDEMENDVEAVAKSPDELSVEERYLHVVVYKNVVGSRCAAWRITTTVVNKEKSKGKKEQSKFAKECFVEVEGELQKNCGTLLGVSDTTLIPKVSSREPKVLYLKMKAKGNEEQANSLRNILLRSKVSFQDPRYVPGRVGYEYDPQGVLRGSEGFLSEDEGRPLPAAELDNVADD